MSKVVSIRLADEAVLRLKLLACKLSLQQQKDVRWTALVREALEQILAKADAEGVDHE